MTTVIAPVTRFSSSSVGSANNTVLQIKMEILTSDLYKIATNYNLESWKSYTQNQSSINPNKEKKVLAESFIKIMQLIF